MYTTLFWECPYCGLRNYNREELENDSSLRPRIVTCDSERGGCEGVVVLDATITITPRVRRVQGEMKRVASSPAYAPDPAYLEQLQSVAA